MIIITGLRIQALSMVTSADFTYSRGYLALLSILGALLGIITCCAPFVLSVCIRAWRDRSLPRSRIWARWGTLSRHGRRSRQSRRWYGRTTRNHQTYIIERHQGGANVASGLRISSIGAWYGVNTKQRPSESDEDHLLKISTFLEEDKSQEGFTTSDC